MIKKIIKKIKNKTLIKSIKKHYYRKHLLKKDGSINMLNYLKLSYITLGYKINFNEPKTFNEKIQWLKFNKKEDIYTKMVDKYESKKFFATKIDSKYIVPTIGIYDSFDVIDFTNLPNKFVIKTTHDSGGVLICRNKNTFDLKNAKQILNKSLKTDYYKTCLEYPYKNVPRRIIVEELLEPKNEKGLIEYKIFCFNGIAKLVLVCKGNAHGEGRTNDFYDLDFNHIPVRVTYPNSKEKETKPDNFDEMLNIAYKLAENTIQLRVDFYLCDDKIYVGETTFFHDSGMCKFTPQKYDDEFGKLVNLPIR